MGLIRSLWERLLGARAEDPEIIPERLIVGLGNPGSQYAATRHNIGFRILERLAERAGGQWRMDRDLEARIAAVELAGRACLLVEPQTFMNRSGRSVARALDRWPDLDPSSDLLIAYDDMDLPTGRIRLRPKGGGGGHNGIGSVLAELDTKEIPRLRFGVGRPESGAGVLDWVLAPFLPEEEDLLHAAVDRAVEAIEASIRDGVSVAMGQFNASS